MNILTEIVEKRKALIRRSGFEMGVSVPEKRSVPLVPFLTDPLLICEIKRKSPSKGDISLHLDAREQATLYHSKGIRNISVLTEPHYFAGSLSDLMTVKKAYPDIAVLRKDFLFSVEDIELSFRAGADAVLLIAAILEPDMLALMYTKAKLLGMEALVEVHSREDVKKAAGIQPTLTGINSRDLTTFAIDRIIPLQLKRHITWDTSLVFESGIHTEEDALLPMSAGFRGVLVGEAVVKNPGLIDALIRAFSKKRRRFWGRLYRNPPPYVKICGITCEEDAYHAAEEGADMLGFNFFPRSPRKVEPALLKKIKNCDILKVAVVVTGPEKRKLEDDVNKLFTEGLIDAIQFHGDESPEDCFSMAFPYYKALQIKDSRDCERISTYRCPRVLIDAFSSSLHGGTGKKIPFALVEEAQKKLPLWLAGGMGPDTVTEVIRRFSPELIDASSRLEKAPGKKDPKIVKAFIKAVKR
jgi:indole-3-glycerol phosphate synthase/phosphoribosylanthranilate isomerase